MKKALIYVKGDVVECWITQSAFAESRCMFVGTIRNSMSMNGCYRDKRGGVLKYVEVNGEDSRKGNTVGNPDAFKGYVKKKAVRSDDGDLPI